MWPQMYTSCSKDANADMTHNSVTIVVVTIVVVQVVDVILVLVSTYEPKRVIDGYGIMLHGSVASVAGLSRSDRSPGERPLPEWLLGSAARPLSK